MAENKTVRELVESYKEHTEQQLAEKRAMLEDVHRRWKQEAERHTERIAKMEGELADYEKFLNPPPETAEANFKRKEAADQGIAWGTRLMSMVGFNLGQPTQTMIDDWGEAPRLAREYIDMCLAGSVQGFGDESEEAKPEAPEEPAQSGLPQGGLPVPREHLPMLFGYPVLYGDPTVQYEPKAVEIFANARPFEVVEAMKRAGELGVPCLVSRRCVHGLPFVVKYLPE